MEKLVLVVLQKNEDAFNLFYDLRQHWYVKDQYSVLQGAVFNKKNGELAYKDGFNQSNNGISYLEGGLIGALVGVLLGPFGIFLGSMVGVSIAQYSAAQKDAKAQTLFQFFKTEIKEDDYCVLLHVEEKDAIGLDTLITKYPLKVMDRRNTEEIYQEIALAKEYQDEVFPKDEIETKKQQYADEKFSGLGSRALELEAKAKSFAKEMSDNIQKKIHQFTKKDTPPQDENPAPTEEKPKEETHSSNSQTPPSGE